MKRNKFSLSHYKLTTMDHGKLVPIGLIEVLPGDSIQHSTKALIRMSPLNTPVMHPDHVRIHHWFVPFRLIWEDWEKFITGGPDGLDASEYPTVTTPGGGFAIQSLADYLGIPTGIAGKPVSALPFRAYALIYNEWYRDGDLVNPLTIDKTSGADTTTNQTLQNVAWEKDYYTTSRPWAQKGPQVTLPLGDEAPIKGIGKINANFNTASQAVRESDGTTPTYANAAQIDPTDAAEQFYVEEGITGTGGTNDFPWIRADLSSATAVDINTVRRAFAIQRYEEARARYGSRYTEYLRYLGVRSSDARLQRPEYLGGGKQTVQFSEVLQTGGDLSGEPVGVGNLRGHGIAAMRSNRYRRFFEEHGYVISLMSVLPKTIYTQSLPRLWNRRTKEDHWQKELEHIGQQEVLQKEVNFNVTNPDATFGFQDRYDELRRQESNVSGGFRSGGGYETWHMGRIFASNPTLNGAFVTSDPTNRIFQATSEVQMFVMASHSIQARRLLTKFGNSLTF